MKKINFRHIKKTAEGYALTLAREYRAVFGFGEKFDSVNQKGKFVRACVREKCFYQGEYTYCSMPFFLTPDGFGIYVDTYVEVDFDFRKEGELTISFPAGSHGEEANIWYFEGTPKEILTQYRTLVGLPRLFPKWVLGAWMSANRWHTQEEVEEQRMLTKKLNFPHNVLVIEPWSDLTTHYLFNNCSIPPKEGNEAATYAEMHFSEPWQDPRALVDALHADGIRVLLWVVPVYAQGGNLETRCNVEQALRDNEYVKQHRECVLNADGTPYEIPHTWMIGSMVPDFTNAISTEHWFNHFRYLKDTVGIDGFKTDGGEFIHDRTVTFSDGTTGLEGQNRYAELYTQAFADFMGEEGIVFSRAGGQRSPTHTVLWAGDQESTWSEFGSVLKAGLSAGLSGFSAWGFDISGFSGYLPSRELYLRSVQTAAFVPVMQWHSDPVSNNRCDFTGAWKTNDRSPWNMAAYLKDEGLLDLLREQFFLHYNLMPCFYDLLREASKTGIPILRHLSLEFPEDDATYGIEDEFMLGSSLLVAPVLRDYTAVRKVYLPRGRWFDLYTGAIYGGGWNEIRLDERHIPVFMRENGCVPLNLKGGKLCSDVGNRLDGYCELTFLISGEGKYEFSDDLGNSILLVWNLRECYAKKNKTQIPFKVLRIGKDRVYGK